MAASSTNTSLSSSVTALRSSLSLLDSSITILDHGISDFPRMRKVLTSTRHFELLPQSTLQTAQQTLAAELTPAITKLLSRSEAHIAKMERREGALIAKSELQQGRLEGKAQLKKKKSLDRVVEKKGMVGGEEKVIRLKALRQKKERLGYAVERLQLQSQQKQRQLRMSIAATKD
ncbi:mitotic spindle biogenesis protein [Phlyctema vagabunda]|uniref:DASH complex subunit SPC19 n=1 Tax=Phlyctema vagabunda TaxID=108571 RepID=A0ABR4PAW2_9HELO